MTKSELSPRSPPSTNSFRRARTLARDRSRRHAQMLEAEMTDALGAEKASAGALLGYRSGYYTRTFVTRVGKLELRVPQTETGGSQPSSSNATSAPRRPCGDVGGDVRAGVSTLKLKPITEHCAATPSRPPPSPPSTNAWTKSRRLRRRPLAEPFPYLILDARYEKVREGGVVMSQAVLIAIGVDWDGRRQILAVDMANREVDRPGSTFFSACASAASMASSSSSPTITPAFAPLVCRIRAARKAAPSFESHAHPSALGRGAVPQDLPTHGRSLPQSEDRHRRSRAHRRFAHSGQRELGEPRRTSRDRGAHRE